MSSRKYTEQLTIINYQLTTAPILNPKSQITNHKSQSGFTVIELIISVTILSIIFLIAFGSFFVLNKAHKKQDELSEANHNARVAMDVLLRTMKLAGSGLTNGSITASIGAAVNGATDTVTIIHGGSDTVTFVGIFDDEKGRLGNAASSGDTTIILENKTQTDEFGTGTSPKRYISIGGQDAYTVTGIDRDAFTITLGSTLNRNYANTTPVYMVKDVTFRIEEDNNISVLKVSEPTLSGKQPLVEYITNIQLELIENNTKGSITVVAVTKTQNNGTVTLHSLVGIRNR
ncbi:MAG: PilW family protein [Candidatus Anammoxibacter sp.]